MKFENVYMQHNVFADLPELLLRHLVAEKLLLLSDANSFAAYELYDFPLIIARHINLLEVPKVTLKAAEDLGKIARDYDAIIAVGSGSINDLAKYAAHFTGVPYVIIASAASMNGYLSPTASLYHDGIKQSFKAAPPRAVFADLQVLENAPRGLTASGVGDVLCRSSIEFDMCLAHHFTGFEFPRAIFAQMQSLEASLLAKLDLGENYIVELMDCLLYGGVAMQQFQSSAPASQSEHMLVHLLEMLEPDVAQAYFHGQMVGSASILMRQLQQNLPSSFVAKSFEKCELSANFSVEIIARWNEEYCAKNSTIKSDLEIDIAKMHNDLAGLTILSAADLSQYLQKVGAPTDLTQMGFSAKQQNYALNNAQFTRNRLTILDFVE